MVVDDSAVILGVLDGRGGDKPTRRGFRVRSEDFSLILRERFDGFWNSEDDIPYEEYARRSIEHLRKMNPGISDELISKHLGIDVGEVRRLLRNSQNDEGRVDLLSRFPRDLLARARDIHSGVPRWRFRIDRVGGVGIAIPVALGNITVVGKASVLVGLPGDRRGVDLSRENEALLSMAGSPPERIVAGTIERMAELLPYTTSLEVRLRFTALMDGEPYRVGMLSRRESDKLISGTSVRVVGATACPCSQELIRTFLRSRSARDVGGLTGTHTQRSVGTLKILVNGKTLPDHLRMARIVEEAMSSPTRTLLKRPEEATLVMRMIENPKLTEDVLRDVLAGVVKEFGEMKNALVFASVRSMESVHKHDLYAERRATIQDLLEEVGE